LPGSKPRVPDDLESGQALPFLPKDKAEDENAKFLYGRLRREYYAKYEDYKSLLDGSCKLIPKEDIKKYTTQIEGINGKTNGEYLGVKELRIYCQFPYQDEVGKIGVVDLPGLGDDTIFDIELLIKTLKQDIDFILFVRRPDPLGDDWQESDRQMYKIAREALGDFPISQCSFMVFNRMKIQEEEKSQRACERFKATMGSQEINVRKSVIADCTNPDEVKNEILSPVLKELTDNNNDVYEQYLRSHNQRLQTLKREISENLEEARNALEGYNQQGEKGFTDWFEDDLLRPLKGKVLQKKYELEDKQYEPAAKFEQEVNKVVNTCQENNLIPSEIDIQGFRNYYGGSYKIAYYMCINEVKKRLTEKFKSLADALKESERNLQLSAVQILSEHGELKKLTREQGIEFYDEIEKQLPHHTPGLRQAFRDIKKSTDTYGDTIIRWIQPHLDELNPDKHLDPISQNQCSENNLNLTSEQVEELQNTTSNLTDEQVTELENNISNPTPELLSKIGAIIVEAINVPLPFEQSQRILQLAIEQIYPLLGRLIRKFIPQESVNQNQVYPINSYQETEKIILEKIDALRHQVVNKCEQTLRTKLSFPNEEAYSKFDKFVTQAFTDEKATREWRDFYQDEKNLAILWPGAEQKENSKQIEQEWQRLVDSSIAVSQKDELLLHKS
ncbi:MAG: hypothetical protein ACREPR_11670, partial [Brasilonema sp.]